MYLKFRQNRVSRGHNFDTDSRSLTIPDIVPTLKEIILSGSQTLVGNPIFDDSPETGFQRLIVQGAPLEMILNAQLGDYAEDTDVMDTNEVKEPKVSTKQAENNGETAPSAAVS